MGNVSFFLGSDTHHPHLLAHPKHVAQNVPFFSGLVQLTPLPPTTWRTAPKNVAQGQSCTLDGLTRRVRSHQTRILVKFHILYGHLKKVLELQSAVFQIIWNYIRFTILRKVSHIWSCLWSHFKIKGFGLGVGVGLTVSIVEHHHPLVHMTNGKISSTFMDRLWP